MVENAFISSALGAQPCLPHSIIFQMTLNWILQKLALLGQGKLVDVLNHSRASQGWPLYWMCDSYSVGTGTLFGYLCWLGMCWWYWETASDTVLDSGAKERSVTIEGNPKVGCAIHESQLNREKRFPEKNVPLWFNYFWSKKTAFSFS